MAAHRPIDPELLKAARQGILTRSNTRKGTAERRAVDRATYLERRKAHPELTARQAAGHEGPGDIPPSATVFVQTPSGPVILFDAQLSRRDVRRAGRYLSLVGQLAEGRLSGDAFRARVRPWRPVTVLGPADLAGSYRLVSDPDAALILADRLRGEGRTGPLIDSGRRRPTQRRRSR